MPPWSEPHWGQSHRFGSDHQAVSNSRSNPRALHETSETSETAEYWVAGSGGDRPIMGPNVLVSNLWEVRDFWEWLMPGYHESDKEHEPPALSKETRPLGRSL